jgi:hypothetical protein
MPPLPQSATTAKLSGRWQRPWKHMPVLHREGNVRNGHKMVKPEMMFLSPLTNLTNHTYILRERMHYINDFKIFEMVGSG